MSPDLKSWLILLGFWMVTINLAIVETSKQRPVWGGRTDQRIFFKSREKESPAALGRLTGMLKALHAQP